MCGAYKHKYNQTFKYIGCHSQSNDHIYVIFTPVCLPHTVCALHTNLIKYLYTYTDITLLCRFYPPCLQYIARQTDRRKRSIYIRTLSGGKFWRGTDYTLYLYVTTPPLFMYNLYIVSRVVITTGAIYAQFTTNIRSLLFVSLHKQTDGMHGGHYIVTTQLCEYICAQ
jgi:hypothetical protein